MENIKKFALTWWSDFKYETCIFLYLYIRMMLDLPYRIISWCSTYYAINYSYGFVSRGLIGSIFNFVTDGDISRLNAINFVFVFNYILCVLLAWVFGKVIRGVADNKKRKLVMCFIATYLMMPFSLNYLFAIGNFGRMDLYLYIITLVQLLIIWKKPTLLKYIIVAIFSFICVLIHEAYPLYIFPILFIVLSYQLYKNHFDKKLVAGVLCILVLIGIPFLYFNLYSKTNIENSKEMFKIVNESTDLKVNELLIDYEYYKHNISEQFNYFTIKFIKYNLTGLLFVLIWLLPVNLFFIYIFRKFIKIHRYLNVVALVLSIFIPLCTMASDWGRWFAALYNCFMIVCIILLVNDNKTMFDLLEKIREKVRGFEFSYWAYFVFISAAGVFCNVGIYTFISGIT